MHHAARSMRPSIACASSRLRIRECRRWRDGNRRRHPRAENEMMWSRRQGFMRRLTLLRLKVMLILALAIVVPEQLFGPPTMQAPQAPTQAPAAQPAQTAPATPPPPMQIPLELFKVPDGFEVTLWATTPMLRNPTNIDIDRDGRIWVAEGVRYRQHYAR